MAQERCILQQLPEVRRVKAQLQIRRSSGVEQRAPYVASLKASRGCGLH